MNRGVLLLLGIIAPLAPAAPVAASPFAVRAGVVHGDSGNLFGCGPGDPARKFSRALKRFPNTRLFRVTWNSSASLASDSGIALYDRRAHTLKLNYSLHGSHGDGDGVVEWRSEEAWMYSGVSDSMLRKWAAQNADRYNGDDSFLAFFPRLRWLGARERKIKHFYRRFKSKA